MSSSGSGSLSRTSGATQATRVVVLGRVRLRGKESGVEVDQPHGWLVEFQDGMVFRFQHFARPHEALEAAGLSE